MRCVMIVVAAPEKSKAQTGKRAVKAFNNPRMDGGLLGCLERRSAVGPTPGAELLG